MYKTGIPLDTKYHKKNLIEPAKWSILEKALKQYDKSISILDVGCSGGGKLLYLYNMGYRNIQGIDYADDVFKPFWDAYPFLNIKKGNAERLSIFHKGKFDVVYASHLLEHLPNPQLCVKEVKRILKKTGQFIIGVPNGYHLNDIIMRKIQKLRYGTTDHLQVFSLADISNMLVKYGFRIQKVEKVYGSLEFFQDVRINNVIFHLPLILLYKLCKRVYWKEQYYNIIAKPY